MKISMLKPTSALVAAAFAVAAISCNPAKKEEDNSMEEDSVATEEVAMVEEIDFWLISEHQMNDVPLTTKAEAHKAKTESVVSDDSEEAEENAVDAEIEEEEMEEELEYGIYSAEELEEELLEEEYEAIDEIEVTEMIIPLGETETVVSYSKKGKAQDTLQVISDGSGEVQQVIFTHKKHKDVYDVSAGMSGKEVKKLRKEMKHMVKHGKVFLYDDTSNIMYLMDAQDAAGDEIVEADVESMTVEAVIWKDKKHHKNK